LLLFINVREKGLIYMMMKDLASVNLFLILILLVVGFGVIKIVKKKFED